MNSFELGRCRSKTPFMDKIRPSDTFEHLVVSSTMCTRCLCMKTQLKKWSISAGVVRSVMFSLYVIAILLREGILKVCRLIRRGIRTFNLFSDASSGARRACPS